MIRLRYTKESPWSVEFVNPKRGDFSEHYNNTFDSQSQHLQSNWRSLLAYFLANKEMKKHAYDKSGDRLRGGVMSWMLELKHPGATHKSLYVVLIDSGGDFTAGRLNGNVPNSPIWNSIKRAVDTFLTDLVEKTKPKEYEIQTRYYHIGVAKRESKDNELWTYMKDEGGGRRSYQNPLTLQGFFP